jgi:hypothetical protein
MLGRQLPKVEAVLGEAHDEWQVTAEAAISQHASMVLLTEKKTEEVAPSTTGGPIRAGGA